MKNAAKEISFFLFHINPCSLSKSFEEVHSLLPSANINFDVVIMRETQILKHVFVSQNIILNNYFFEHTITGSSAGGTLLYVANHLLKKFCSDLNTCNKYKLEFTFIEVTNPYKSSITVGTIYKNLKTELTISISNSLILFRMGLFGMWEKNSPLPILKSCCTYPTKRKFITVIPWLN